ncbi:hypothetical protein [Mycobacterium sp.]|uniref:hypothetical protein n=1 Tax=Mycobacterium sp. TaxID=1785 RepID=UPI003BAAFF83
MSSAIKEMAGGISFAAGSMAGGLIGYEIGDKADGKSGAQTGETLGAVIGGALAGIPAIALTGQYRAVLGTVGHLGELVGEVGTGLIPGGARFETIGNLVGYGVGSGAGKAAETVLGARGGRQKSKRKSGPPKGKKRNPASSDQPTEEQDQSSGRRSRRAPLLEEESLQDDSDVNVDVQPRPTAITSAAAPPQPGRPSTVVAEIHPEPTANSETNRLVYDREGIADGIDRCRRVISRSQSALDQLRELEASLDASAEGQTAQAAHERLTPLVRMNQKAIADALRTLDYLDLATTNMDNLDRGLAQSLTTIA